MCAIDQNRTFREIQWDCSLSKKCDSQKENYFFLSFWLITWDVIEQRMLNFILWLRDKQSNFRVFGKKARMIDIHKNTTFRPDVLLKRARVIGSSRKHVWTFRVMILGKPKLTWHIPTILNSVTHFQGSSCQWISNATLSERSSHFLTKSVLRISVLTKASFREFAYECIFIKGCVWLGKLDFEISVIQ